MNEDAEDVLPEAPSVDIPVDVPDPKLLLVFGPDGGLDVEDYVGVVLQARLHLAEDDVAYANLAGLLLVLGKLCDPGRPGSRSGSLRRRPTSVCHPSYGGEVGSYKCHTILVYFLARLAEAPDGLKAAAKVDGVGN